MHPANYKAAIFRGVGRVDVVDLPYPECGDDEAIVRNLLTGICGSDIFAFQKHGPESFIWIDEEFGHEAISEVVELGRNVTGLKVGDRVFVNQHKAMRDRRRASATGGFSNYLRIPQCEAGYSLLKIDNDLPLRTAVLFEPFVVSTRGAKVLDPRKGDNAIVFGAGIIGLTSAIMLQLYGCEKVMLVDYFEFRLEIARRLGLATCNPSKDDLKTKAFAEFGVQSGFTGDRCAARLYVDAVGVKSVIESFMQLAPRNGALSVIGVHKEPAPLNLTALTFNNLHIHGAGSGEAEDLVPEILEMMRARRDELGCLVTHEFKIEDINEALALASKPTEAQKVCISF